MMLQSDQPTVTLRPGGARLRVTQKELADRLGCKKQNVNKYVKKGVLKVGEDGKLDLEDSLQQLKRNVNPARQMTAAQKLTPLEELADEEDDDLSLGADLLQPDGNKVSFATAKTRSELARAELAELALQEKRAKLVDKDEVHREVFSLFRELRDRLQTAAYPIAGKLVTLATEREIAAALEAELAAVLMEFADKIEKQG